MRRWLTRAWDVLTLVEPDSWRLMARQGRWVYLREWAILGLFVALVVTLVGHRSMGDWPHHRDTRATFLGLALSVGVVLLVWLPLGLVQWYRGERRYGRGPQ